MVISTMSTRSSFTAKEDEVPSSSDKAAHLCVSKEELLLATSVDSS